MKRPPRSYAALPIRVWQELPSLSTAAVKIAVALAGATDYKTGACEYSLEALARIAGVSRATAAAGKKELLDRKLLKTKRRGRDENGKTKTAVTRWLQVSWVRCPNGRTSKRDRLQVQKSGPCKSSGLDSIKSLFPESLSEKKARKKRAATDPRVKEFIAWFAREYEEDVGIRYEVRGGKDGALVKGLLHDLSLEELQAAAQNMFKATWPKGAKDIGLLSSQINGWRIPHGKHDDKHRRIASLDVPGDKYARASL